MQMLAVESGCYTAFKQSRAYVRVCHFEVYNIGSYDSSSRTSFAHHAVSPSFHSLCPVTTFVRSTLSRRHTLLLKWCCLQSFSFLLQDTCRCLTHHFLARLLFLVTDIMLICASDGT